MTKDIVTIDDLVFGQMEYNHSWLKKEIVNFFGDNYEVVIIAKAYTGDSILQSQQENYATYLEILSNKQTEIEALLLNYCSHDLNASLPLNQCLTIKTILFERDGSWCILFDSEFAIEEGVGLYFSKENIQVGRQDDFL
jgi:acid stress-induced BolA-like protein IbaG/YrbA